MAETIPIMKKIPGFSHADVVRGVRVTYQSSTFEGLVKAVSDGRKKSGMKRANYNLVYNELLAKYPQSSPRKAKPKLYYQDAINSAKRLFSGGKALGENILGLTVDETELKRREAICLKCPAKGAMAGCKQGCGMSQAAVNALDGASKAVFGKARNDISVALRKQFCDVCGCALSVMLPAKIESFPADTPEEKAKRPAACWLTR